MNHKTISTLKVVEYLNAKTTEFLTTDGHRCTRIHCHKKAQNPHKLTLLSGLPLSLSQRDYVTQPSVADTATPGGLRWVMNHKTISTLKVVEYLNAKTTES